ncbi:hypothetical protein FB45DRAFT_877888 [Roridomyces roridus]|uniref:Uncharacterized protein n=1 Tax=Roridomyces roridus TaxID=1738132 RepID=A0AAD7B1F6_9AGAR|nr:hypothetical protein FB45DRAFT_877888 [Roridomyces roridus]
MNQNGTKRTPAKRIRQKKDCTMVADSDVFSAPSGPQTGQIPRFRLKVPKEPIRSAPETFTSTHHLPSASLAVRNAAETEALCINDTTNHWNTSDVSRPSITPITPETSLRGFSRRSEVENDNELVPLEEDELCLLDPGSFPGHGYPRPQPPADFQAGMSEIEQRRLQHVAPTATELLPLNPYGKWTKSMMTDEDLKCDTLAFLWEEKEVTAAKPVAYLSQPDVMEKHGINEPISERTACRYLHELGYS